MADVVYTHFTQEEFRTKYGIDLDQSVADEVTDGKVDRFIDRCVEQILDYIAANDNYIDVTTITITAQTTAAQNTIINRAAMMQAKYVLDNGDVSTLSGYSAVAGAKALTPQQIAEMQLCQEAKNLLNDRLIDRSLGA